MKTKLLLGLLAAMFYFVLALPVGAECREGKLPVTLETPSGKVKTLCVSNNALEGIENAAEHSSGTIIPASCPAKLCWSAEELSMWNEKYESGLFCEAQDNGYACRGTDGTGTTDLVLRWVYLDYLDAYICYNAAGTKNELTLEQAKACDTLLDEYKKN